MLPLLMEKDDSIFIAGHRGLVGSAILRKLRPRDLPACSRALGPSSI